jgi:hypothetical protein
MKSLPPDPIPDDPSPGVPGFRTWRGIYLFVFIVFAAVVALLAFFSHWFA